MGRINAAIMLCTARQWYMEECARLQPVACIQMLPFPSLGTCRGWLTVCASMQDHELWVMVKTDSEQCGSLVAACVGLVLLLAATLQPFMPSFSSKVHSPAAPKQATSGQGVPCPCKPGRQWHHL